jgi:uncharacterized protein YodC (DUF2158 family)
MSEMVKQPVERVATFEPGDRVMLTPGGPRMTIVAIGSRPGTVWCQWPIDGGFDKGVFLARHLKDDHRPAIHPNE